MAPIFIFEALRSSKLSFKRGITHLAAGFHSPLDGGSLTQLAGDHSPRYRIDSPEIKG